MLNKYWFWICILVALSTLFVIKISFDKILTERDVARSEVILLRQQLDQQNAAVFRLKALSNEQQEKLSNAIELGKKERKESEKQVIDILSQDVPSNCFQAIKWGAEQGPKLARYSLLG